MLLPVALVLGSLPLSSFFEPSSTLPAPSVTYCFRRSPHLWQYLASSGQFCPQEEQNIFKFEAGNNMASLKSCSSPDLPAMMRAHKILLYICSNFLFICSNILFLQQQPLKQLQQLSLLCSKFYLFLKKIFKFAATFKFAAAIIKNCSNF